MTAPTANAGRGMLWRMHPATNVRAIGEASVVLHDPNGRLLRLPRSVWRVLRAFDRPAPLDAAAAAAPGTASETLAAVVEELIRRALIVRHPLVLGADELVRVESMRRQSAAPSRRAAVAQRMMAVAHNDANRPMVDT